MPPHQCTCTVYKIGKILCVCVCILCALLTFRVHVYSNILVQQGRLSMNVRTSQSGAVLLAIYATYMVGVCL